MLKHDFSREGSGQEKLRLQWRKKEGEGAGLEHFLCSSSRAITRDLCCSSLTIITVNLM